MHPLRSIPRVNMFDIFVYLFCTLIGVIERTSCAENSSSPVNTFIKLSTDPDVFVDKTYLLAEVVNLRMMGGYMMTCPPKFGKTTNLHMMEAFFGIDWTSEGEILKGDKNAASYYKTFSNLNVNNDRNMMQNHFAQYFVLYLDMSEVDITSLTKYWSTLRKAVTKCIKKYRYFIEKLAKEEDVSFTRDEKRKIQNYMVIMNDTSDFPTVKFAIKNTAYLLTTYYHRRVMVLVDQADTRFQWMLSESTEDDEIIKIEEELMSFYHSFIKLAPRSVYYTFFTCTNEFLSQKFAKTLKVIHQRKFLVDHAFAKFCGITYDEMDLLLDENGLINEERKNVLRFFFGYAVGLSNILLYNPLSSTSGFKNPRILCESKATPVWVKKVNLTNIWSCLRYPDIREKMSKLLENGTVTFSEKPYFDGNITTFASFVKNIQFEKCNRLKEFPQDIFYKYLFENGYLTCVQSTPELLCLPNQEIKLEVQRWIKTLDLLGHTLT